MEDMKKNLRMVCNYKRKGCRCEIFFKDKKLGVLYFDKYGGKIGIKKDGKVTWLEFKWEIYGKHEV